MSRITLVPKQDHIRRNCWATFLRDPCLLAATYERVNDFYMMDLTLHLALSLETDREGLCKVSKFKVWSNGFQLLFLSAKILVKE